MTAIPSIDDVRALLGKKVRVTLNRGSGEHPATVTTGTLLGFGDGGDFEILEANGFMHYCWPLLDIEELHADT